MPRTENLGLYIADDDTFKSDNQIVAEWRAKLNGVGDGTTASPYSDYQIIDQAFGDIMSKLVDLQSVLEKVNGIDEEESVDE